MSRPETFIVHCSECKKPLRDADMALESAPNKPPALRFDSHPEANRTMAAEGWYYDAETDRCPEHWPGHEGQEEPLFAAGAFHPPAFKVPEGE